MGEERITMTAREQRRAHVLTRLVSGHLSQGEAAQLLGLSVRQVRRLTAGYAAGGPAALVHGNRGRASPQRVPEAVRAQVVALARERYAGFNHQHLTEQLAADGIILGRTTVRRIVAAAGLASPRPRRPAKHRRRRERMGQEGMLLQADGSRHQWLGPDGPYLTLIGAIDDATGTVPWAVFRAQEDAAGYLEVLGMVVQTHGIPLALYVDRHGIFERNPREPRTLEEELTGGRLPTQVGRVLGELGIRHIAARSPQAKGRIERFWGTCQDRLVSALRLAGAQTLAEANAVLWEWLPQFNPRFAVPATQPGSAYRPVPDGVAPEQVFCFKYARVVAADNTVRFGAHRLQLLPGPDRLSYARARVEVHERLDGSLAVYHHGQCLASQPAPPEAPVLRARRGARAGPTGAPAPMPAPVTAAAPTRNQEEEPSVAPSMAPTAPPPPRPAPDHPWRTSFLPRRTKSLAT
jgi:transposase